MPPATKPPITELTDSLAEAMPLLEPDQQRLALALYRQLAGGKPVSAGQLASQLSCDRSQVAETLEGWPGVFRADDGAIASFWGLAIPEMPHRFRVEGRLLHTWCAWDALFIPELIGRTAEVESRPPNGGEPVHLVVDPDGVREVEPESAVVSMLSTTEALGYRVILGFCNFVHFFPSADAGAAWVAEHPGTFLLSVAEAHELGRLVNRRRFGESLSSVDKASEVSR
ncbi:MAG: organomercurial lyase [Solirubrobacterales bacterium]